MQNIVPTLNLQSLFHSIFQKFKYILISYLVLAVLLGSYYAVYAKYRPRYVSKSLVFISMQGSSSGSSHAVSLDELVSMKDTTNTFVQVIDSYRLANKVVSTLHLNVTPEVFLSRNLKVSLVESTPFIQILVTWPDSNSAYAINRSVLDNVPQLLDDMNISGSLVVVDGPLHPQGPNVLGLTTLFLIWLLGGAFIGVLWVLLNELLHSGLRSGEEIEQALALPSIGMIPKGRLSRRRTGKRASARAAEEKKAFFELLLNLQNAGQVFVINSALAREGKDYVTAMLARTAAQFDKRVAIIETDGIFDSVGRHLLGQKHQDIEVPVGKSGDFAAPVSGEAAAGSVDLYTIGSFATGDADAYAHLVEQLTGVIFQMRQKYDLILVHNRPVEAFEYACLLSKIADSIMVIRHDSTPLGTVRHSISLMRVAGCRFAGIVLDDINNRGPFNYFEMLRG